MQRFLFGGVALVATAHFSVAQNPPIQPYVGVTGYQLQSEYQFGTAAGNNVKSLTDLQRRFTPDSPLGRVNKDLANFSNFFTFPWYTHSTSEVAAAARTHQFETEALVLNSSYLGGGYIYDANSPHIESGAIITNETVYWPVIVEVLAKQPKGRAHMPSIWLNNYHGGPNGNEIDIMESAYNAPLGVRDNRSQVHQGAINRSDDPITDTVNYHYANGHYDAGVDLSEDYHYYTCVWSEYGDVDMYVDAVKVRHFRFPWIQEVHPNILIYLSTGTDNPAYDWPGPIVDNATDGSNTFTPDDPNSTFKIRHIRIFKRPKDIVVPSSEPNLAFQKPVVCSSQTAGTPALAVSDGNTGTRWGSSVWADGQWIYVDLGSIQAISRVKLNWESWASFYQIQTSNDATNWTNIYATTTGNGGIDDLTGLNGSGRYVRMFGEKRGTGFGTSLFEFEVYGPPPPASLDLALNKPMVVASSTTYGTVQAVNDGNSATRWSSSFADGQWIYVDLGSTQSIARVKLLWEAAYASGYKIQASNDAATWTDIYSTTTGNGQVDDDVVVPNASGRFVRVLCTTRASGFGISLFDFEVYGPTATSNLAPSGTLSGYSTQQTGNEAVKVIDGIDNLDSNRWTGSTATYPQWIEVDLGGNKLISGTEMVPYGGRAYQFKVEAKPDGGTLQMVVDRTSNTQGTPVADSFTPVIARYVRLTVTGASNYSGGWTGVREFKIMGTEVPIVNLAPSGTLSGYSTQQTGNEAVKAIDGIDNLDSNRWTGSTATYPQWIEVDLGSNKQIRGTEMVPYGGRAYQFTVEAKPAGGNYQMVVDQTSNTQGTPVADSFTPLTARYVRLTVTGAYGYSGGWTGVREFKIMGQ